MRNKLRRQEAVVFPVKANGTKNMASAFKLFFPFSYLDSETLGNDKTIAVPGVIAVYSQGCVPLSWT